MFANQPWLATDFLAKGYRRFYFLIMPKKVRPVAETDGGPRMCAVFWLVVVLCAHIPSKGQGNRAEAAPRLTTMFLRPSFFKIAPRAIIRVNPRRFHCWISTTLKSVRTNR
jgi:hypothetical protein